METSLHDRKETEFTEFVRQSRSALHRVARLLCGDVHEADDLVQNALWAVYRTWDSLKDRDRCFAYCRRTLVNSFIAERRRARWRYEIIGAEQPDRALHEDVLGRVEDGDLLAASLRRLAPRQRAVMVFRVYEDLTAVETAELLGCDAATVRSQMARALASMRRTLVVPEGASSARDVSPGSRRHHQGGAAPAPPGVRWVSRPSGAGTKPRDGLSAPGVTGPREAPSGQ